jgi:S1-C subfamily serine protease
MVKEFLSLRGIRFTERDVSRDRSIAQELINSTGQMGVPVTIIDGKTIVGFDREKFEEAINQGQRPSFGVSAADASKITARQGTGITLGAYVGRIRPGSPAEKAGLAPGDIITELNMQNIANVADFERAVARLSRGNRFSIVFLRANQTLTSEGTL